MKSKQTLILLVLAVGLVAAAIYYKGREEQAIQTAASPTRTITEGLTSATVDRIEIKAPETTGVTLTKLDGVWYMDAANKFRADRNHIAGIFNSIEKEISGEVVSTNPK
ncbi:MAG: hypothetical protein K1X53_13290, partial [Candidatus Sumerlaeaceae bacterium]|nr:hypothetical protein [Candidatus Sumerlaeaceae bacterium]